MSKTKLELKTLMSAPSTALPTSIAKGLGYGSKPVYEDEECKSILAVGQLISRGLTLPDAIAEYRRQPGGVGESSLAQASTASANAGAAGSMSLVQQSLGQIAAPIAVEAATQIHEAIWYGIASLSGNPIVTNSPRVQNAIAVAQEAWSNPWGGGENSHIYKAMMKSLQPETVDVDTDTAFFSLEDSAFVTDINKVA